MNTKTKFIKKIFLISWLVVAFVALTFLLKYIFFLFSNINAFYVMNLFDSYNLQINPVNNNDQINLSLPASPKISVKEYYKKTHINDKGIKFLDTQGMEILEDKIENDLSYGPEIFYLNNILISPPFRDPDKLQGAFSPYVNTIFLYPNITKYQYENLENKVEYLFQIFVHEYNHFFAQTYLKSPISDKNFFKTNPKPLRTWNKQFIKDFKENLGYNDESKNHNIIVYKKKLTDYLDENIINLEKFWNTDIIVGPEPISINLKNIFTKNNEENDPKGILNLDFVYDQFKNFDDSKEIIIVALGHDKTLHEEKEKEGEDTESDVKASEDGESEDKKNIKHYKILFEAKSEKDLKENLKNLNYIYSMDELFTRKYLLLNLPFYYNVEPGNTSHYYENGFFKNKNNNLNYWPSHYTKEILRNNFFLLDNPFLRDFFYNIFLKKSIPRFFYFPGDEETEENKSYHLKAFALYRSVLRHMGYRSDISLIYQKYNHQISDVLEKDMLEKEKPLKYIVGPIKKDKIRINGYLNPNSKIKYIGYKKNNQFVEESIFPLYIYNFKYRLKKGIFNKKRIKFNWKEDSQSSNNVEYKKEWYHEWQQKEALKESPSDVNPAFIDIKEHVFEKEKISLNKSQFYVTADFIDVKESMFEKEWFFLDKDKEPVRPVTQLKNSIIETNPATKIFGSSAAFPYANSRENNYYYYEPKKITKNGNDFVVIQKKQYS